MNNPFSLQGKLAIVTGGGTGIGLGIGKALTASGAQVVIVGRREIVLQEAAKEISATIIKISGYMVPGRLKSGKSPAGVRIYQITPTTTTARV